MAGGGGLGEVRWGLWEVKGGLWEVRWDLGEVRMWYIGVCKASDDSKWRGLGEVRVFRELLQRVTNGLIGLLSETNIV